MCVCVCVCVSVCVCVCALVKACLVVAIDGIWVGLLARVYVFALFRAPFPQACCLGRFPPSSGL